MNESETPLQIAMLLYPGLTLMDLIGPQTVFAWTADIHLVWKNTDLIFSDTGIGIKPTTSFEDCPRQLDILFVPGGIGQQPMLQDPEVLAFLADRAAGAKYITSVCAGSLILGAAGLLQGYKATSHWSAREALRMYGAEPVDARVVTDRNRITGGGVTAGIDFGLVVLAKLRGEDVAKLTQLAMEYDPAPPFNAGNPTDAGPAIVERALSAMTAAIEKQASREPSQVPLN